MPLLLETQSSGELRYVIAVQRQRLGPWGQRAWCRVLGAVDEELWTR